MVKPRGTAGNADDDEEEEEEEEEIMPHKAGKPGE